MTVLRVAVTFPDEQPNCPSHPMFFVRRSGECPRCGWRPPVDQTVHMVIDLLEQSILSAERTVVLASWEWRPGLWARTDWYVVDEGEGEGSHSRPMIW